MLISLFYLIVFFLRTNYTIRYIYIYTHTLCININTSYFFFFFFLFNELTYIF